MTPDEEHGPERFLLRAATTLLSEQNRKDAASFNLFTVLRSGSDEVNLHSRFLHALLDHQTGGQRKNLKEFLGLKCLELREEIKINSVEAKVHREKRDIDLLVTDESSKCALVIENKIYAGDQGKQLHRYYYCDPELKTFRHRHVVYLTLDGHEPTADSQGEVPNEHLSCVSYADLDPWLQGCHNRADDEPELRSSIAQYRKLIHSLTGGGFGDVRMQQLKELIRETGSLGLAKALGEAADEVRVVVVGELWGAIESAVIQALPEEFKRRTPSATHRDRIEQSLGLWKRAPTKWHGLYFSRTKPANEVRSGKAPALGVEINGGLEFFFGVRCLRDGSNDVTPDEGAYDAVEKAVAGSPLAARFKLADDEWWPCWRDVLPDSPTLTDEQLAKLSDPERQKEVAGEIARQLVELWNLLRKNDGTRNLF